MKTIILICTCMSFMCITSAMKRPGEDGPSRQFIRPDQAQELPSIIFAPPGGAMRIPPNSHIPEGTQIQIRVPGGHILTGSLRHGNVPRWIYNQHAQTTSHANVFVHIPGPQQQNLIANVVDTDPNALTDINYQTFEASLLTALNKGYRAAFQSGFVGNAKTPTIYVHHGNVYQMKLNRFG